MAFEFNTNFNFMFNGKQMDGDPMADAPVPEGHEDYGVKLYTFWGMTEAEAQGIHDAEAIKQIRVYRNTLLAESDWTQGADSPLDDATKALWATYRQALRDITDNYSSIDDVVWPEKP